MCSAQLDFQLQGLGSHGSVRRGRKVMLAVICAEGRVGLSVGLMAGPGSLAAAVHTCRMIACISVAISF